MSDVTRILSQIHEGSTTAANQLLPLVYDELRKLAAQKLAEEMPGQTLEATALVHEAYIRLVDHNWVATWSGRRHFFAAAAEAMRRILVERARRKQSLRGGGEFQRVELSEVATECGSPQLDLIVLDAALEKFERSHPRQAELVKLRFFVGLTKHQAAEALGIADSTADLDWAYAKCWLRVEMGGEPDATT